MVALVPSSLCSSVFVSPFSSTWMDLRSVQAIRVLSRFPVSWNFDSYFYWQCLRPYKQNKVRRYNGNQLGQWWILLRPLKLNIGCKFFESNFTGNMVDNQEIFLGKLFHSSRIHEVRGAFVFVTWILDGNLIRWSHLHDCWFAAFFVTGLKIICK